MVKTGHLSSLKDICPGTMTEMHQVVVYVNMVHDAPEHNVL